MKSISHVERKIIEQKLSRLVFNDVGYGDITTQLIDNVFTKAEIVCKSGGIICGVTEAHVLFDNFNVKCIPMVHDGDQVSQNAMIMKLEGDLADILAVERTALNIMMKMSSIASSTREFADLAQNTNSKVRIAATRKTTPGFRFFEKRAVIKGGGDPHRWELDDMVLIKDTHIASMEHNIGAILKRAKRSTSFSKKIEIEVEKPEHALQAAQLGADIIMLDNMNPEMIKNTIAEIKEELIGSSQPIPLFEASGNIDIKNIHEFLKTGVDIISTSSITLNPHILVDLSLKINTGSI